MLSSGRKNREGKEIERMMVRWRMLLVGSFILPSSTSLQPRSPIFSSAVEDRHLELGHFIHL